MVEKKKITKKDWKTVEQFVKDELSRRETSEFRKAHEKKWKEVDRQLKMEAVQQLAIDGRPEDPGWHNSIELGEISKISEIIAADVMRIAFPAERDWFEPHVELEGMQAEDGTEKAPEPLQTIADNTVRALFSQQHADFSFKRRVELSVKESLHHGAFVAEADWYEDMMVMDGTKVKKIGAPTWIPHSMWNCYPDPSPRCISQNMFYNGSMIIRSYMPKWKLEMQKGEGWMPARYKEIPDDEHQVGEFGEQRTVKDLEIITYYGDLYIDRKHTQDIYLPNSKAIIANGVLVYWNPGSLPYPPVIYGGYEKQDPRDPYYTSPIVKLAPIGKMVSIIANEYLDALALNYKPPLVYDGSDPAFTLNGGPVIAPGASVASKGGADFKQMTIGDPNAAMAGLEMLLRTMQEGTGVSAVRTGVPNSDRQTATEVQKIAQGAEVRTVDFIEKLTGYLRTWLYMQHALNIKNLTEYTFYSDDMDSKDFLRITGSQYKRAPVIHFDVVGAKGILGEEQRMMRQTNVTAFASSNQMFAPLLKPRELLLNMYKDAGTKNPERFVQADQQQEDPRLAEMQQIIQALQGELQKAQEKTEVEMAKLEQKREEAILKLQQAQEAKMADVEQKEKDRVAEYTMHIQKLQSDLQGKFDQATTEMRHQIELLTAKSEKKESGPALNIQGSFDDSKIQESLSNVMKKVGAKKKRTIKFIDDDTAEVVDEGDIE